MANLDFRLRHLYQKVASLRLHVLLQFKNNLSAIEELGFKVTSQAGDVVAGSIPFDHLDELTDHPDVIVIEGSRQLKDELDVSVKASNLVDPVTEERLIPSMGSGAIIGIIDSGFDLSHPCFTDEQGKTRILAAWDQVNIDKVAGKPPDKFDYGIEFTQDAINQKIAEQKILVVKNHPLGGGHGTCMAGVAAGNGYPEEFFTGIAPKAELIFVTYNNDRPIGGSAFLLDAIRYIVDRARNAGKPVVINLSQGDNLGAHDGSSLLERAIDYIAEHEGVLIVNSAGNERDGKHHASGQVAEGADHELLFDLQHLVPEFPSEEAIDLWYDGEDRFTVAMKSPDGWQCPWVEPDTTALVTFPNGSQAYISSQTDYPTNHDNRISIILDDDEAWLNGTWSLMLHGKVVKQGGEYDVWVDTPNAVSAITFPQAASNDCTVTLPGTARRIFTVSAFVSRPSRTLGLNLVKDGIGELTSLGPTRDKRSKPDLTAPGFFIFTPGTRKTTTGSNFCNYAYRSGTSLAAPHVTGVVALFLSLNPELKAVQIADALRATASKGKFTGNLPNHMWGAGKLDASAAYKALFTP